MRARVAWTLLIAALVLAAPRPALAAGPSEKEQLAALPQDERQWVEVFVAPIILPEEKKVFLELTQPYERETFKEQFWQRREKPGLQPPLGPGLPLPVRGAAAARGVSVRRLAQRRRGDGHAVRRAQHQHRRGLRRVQRDADLPGPGDLDLRLPERPRRPAPLLLLPALAPGQAAPLDRRDARERRLHARGLLQELRGHGRRLHRGRAGLLLPERLRGLQDLERNQRAAGLPRRRGDGARPAAGSPEGAARGPGHDQAAFGEHGRPEREEDRRRGPGQRRRRPPRRAPPPVRRPPPPAASCPRRKSRSSPSISRRSTASSWSWST